MNSHDQQNNSQTQEQSLNISGSLGNRNELSQNDQKHHHCQKQSCDESQPLSVPNGQKYIHEAYQ